MLIRQATDPQNGHEVLGYLNVGEASRDLGTGVAVNSVGEVGEIDDGSGLYFAVENSGEVTGEGFGAVPVNRTNRGGPATFGDFSGEPLKGNAAFGGEAEGDGWPANFVDFLVGTDDVGAHPAPDDP